MILLLIVIALLAGAIGVQVWYWRNAVSLGVELPRTLKFLMALNVTVLAAALLGVAWFGYTAVASGAV